MINARELQLTLENRQLKRKLKSSEANIKKMVDRNITVANSLIALMKDLKVFATSSYSRELDKLIKDLQEYIDNEVK